MRCPVNISAWNSFIHVSIDLVDLASFQSVTEKKSMGTSMVYKQDRLIESVGDNPVALSGFIRRGLKMKV